MDVIKKHLKLLGTFVLSVFGNAIYDLIQGNAPFPTTSQEWLRWALTVILASVGAYAPRNKLDESQVNTAVARDLNIEQKVTVADTTLDRLPDSVRENVLAHRRRTA